MRPARDHLTAGIGWRDWPAYGPVAVCLHGIGSRATGWARLAEALSGWRVIAWDAPGYGPSAPLPIPAPTTADYAQALWVWLESLALPRVHLVGHSLGTLIGAAFARRWPDHLETLTLASCAQGGGLAPGAPLAPTHQARIDDLATLGPAAFARTRAPRLIHDAAAHPDLVHEATAAMASVTLPGYAQAVRMLATGNLAADCRRIETPTAVIVGSEDLITPPDQSARAHAALPNPGFFVTVPDCGHALPLQAPPALAGLLQSHAPAQSCPQHGATR
jgi:pimeloyl-ACP methyl ester carboxylesterase